MRRFLLALAVMAPANPVAAAGAEQDCFQSREVRQRIESCTEIIQRDPNDATAYHNRAVAHVLAGDVESAIADYSRVIAIAPQNATAYENRGRAYASKGDYAKAVADETKAAELMAKANAVSETAAPVPKKVKHKIAASTKAKNSVAAVRRPPKAGVDASKDVTQQSLWSWFWGGPNQPQSKPGKP